MKKITFKLLMLTMFCLPTLVLAQNKVNAQPEKCLTDIYNANLLETNPDMMGSETFKLNLEQKINNAKNNGFKKVVVNIPLVIHVLHNGEPIGSGPNITDAQVLSQVTVLNEDFRNMVGTPGQSSAGGVDVEVNFVLAQQTPNGCPTNGINRVNICQDGTDQAAVNSWKAQTIWNRDLYMNMWSSKYVGDLNGILGFAQFPGGPANTDGVSAGHTYFGSSDYNDGTFNTSPPYDKGRTMTHEVGHYLGLFHTFQGGCVGAGDGVADTPAVDAPNYGCPTGHSSCGTVDMLENYMDYTDDLCMNTYTAGQKVVVQAVLAGSRSTLSTSNGANPPASVATDVEIAVESTNVSCGTEINPAVIITNWGTSPITSTVITYDIDNGTPTNFNWSGALAYGESETVTLPTMTSTDGDHDINVTVVTTGDARVCNNTDSTCFTLSASAGACASVGNSTDNYFTSTTGVIFNTISNLDNNPGHPNDSDNGYSDFTNLSTDVNKGAAYDLSVFVNTDGPYFVRTLAWIDWNQNCTFDANEEYDLGESIDVDHGVSSASPLSISIPSDAIVGSTTMRIITKWSGNSGGLFTPVACDTGHDGETEDYSLNVLAPLSVDEFGLSAISIFPNPTNGILNIKGLEIALENVEIYSITGQRVMTVTTNLEAINVSAIANGVYFLKLNTANATKTIKFIKE
ncbi:MAG: M43 family zinc metalloprotease [Lacinutrix sp.]|uniref:M43 family zinc metalloprotease n=1 Tax=Lacinutrix sp. TaxID=1937692 RepID=UPI003097A498